ncbi:MAG: low specificity L-threonine aldolase [Anaerolineae bacterium]|nr:low specificity L-threonine aldolase [Anaerolineae bacterium]
MKPVRSFASDNNSGVHSEILAAIAQVNTGHVVGYGNDPYTQAAIARFCEIFGGDIEVFFVYGGTAANVLGLTAALKPYQAVICPETAHINVDECGAPEKFSGCKLIDVPTPDGKLTVDMVAPWLHFLGDPHHVQPRVLSITQSTEMGTLYTPEEIKALADFAHQHGLLVHMDGARICNAAEALNLPFRAFTRDAGVDILSFGGTKNGMMYGEAVIFFDTSLAADFEFIRKQGMQLASKMRFIAAQFNALLTNDLWLRNARQANRMARLLAHEVEKIPALHITQTPQVNAVFVQMPKPIIPRLQERYFFYVWNEELGEVRWMTSFDTTEEDVRSFIACVREMVL